MPLIQLVITLVVVGVILWLINSYIPMQSTIKKILNAVAVIVVILWLLNVFGVWAPCQGCMLEKCMAGGEGPEDTHKPGNNIPRVSFINGAITMIAHIKKEE